MSQYDWPSVTAAPPSRKGKDFIRLVERHKGEKKCGRSGLLFVGGLELTGLAVLALRSEEAQQELVRHFCVRVRVAQGGAPASKGFPGERLCLTKPALILSSLARLCMLLSVSGCLGPSVARVASSTSSISGSASSSLP